MAPVTPYEVSNAVAQLMPNIIRGVQLDFFMKRRVTQTQLLMLLAIHGYRRSTMGTLAHSLHVTLPTASGIVSRLVRSGLVRRCPSSGDRRQVWAELTPKGVAYIHQFQGVIRRRWQEVLASLPSRELVAFHGAIERLRTQLQSPEGAP